MAVISIVYYSAKGQTGVVAQSVAEGARSVDGVSAVHLLNSDEAIHHWDTLNASDAIIFGSPTYMGSVAAPFKAFMDASFDIYLHQRWKDKIAGGFTQSAALCGGKLNTLMDLFVFAERHSMIWIGLGMLPGQPWLEDPTLGGTEPLNRMGSMSGLMTQSDRGLCCPPEEDLLTAQLFGKRIAEMTRIFLTGREQLGPFSEALATAV